MKKYALITSRHEVITYTVRQHACVLLLVYSIDITSCIHTRMHVVAGSYAVILMSGECAHCIHLCVVCSHYVYYAPLMSKCVHAYILQVNCWTDV